MTPQEQPKDEKGRFVAVGSADKGSDPQHDTAQNYDKMEGVGGKIVLAKSIDKAAGRLTTRVIGEKQQQLKIHNLGEWNRVQMSVWSQMNLSFESFPKFAQLFSAMFDEKDDYPTFDDFLNLDDK